MNKVGRNLRFRLVKPVVRAIVVGTLAVAQAGALGGCAARTKAKIEVAATKAKPAPDKNEGKEAAEKKEAAPAKEKRMLDENPFAEVKEEPAEEVPEGTYIIEDCPF